VCEACGVVVRLGNLQNLCPLCEGRAEKRHQEAHVELRLTWEVMVREGRN
jgi:Zn finger protein HypA/HybF involved in hydrogenase expression